MEEVTNIFKQHLLLTAEESCSLSIHQYDRQKGDEILTYCLLVQVLTRSHFNKRAFLDMMQSLWGTSLLVSFRELRDSTFLYCLLNGAEKMRILPS